MKIKSKNVLTNKRGSAIIYSSKEKAIKVTKEKIIQFIAYINVTWKGWNQKKGKGGSIGKVDYLFINTKQWQESCFLQERPGT